MRANKKKRLTVLSEAERLALYSLPDFDDFQRTEYFIFSEDELSLALRRKGRVEQVYCVLHIGYFKAKQTFFQFSWQDVPPEDIAFIVQRYFPGTTSKLTPLSQYEYYAQRSEIASLFG